MTAHRASPVTQSLAPLVLRARRIVTPAGEVDGEVVVVGDRITEIRPPRPDRSDRSVTRIPDDCVLMPGLVDSHVHVNEPGRTEWEGFTTATAAAAAGGVTTVVDMPLNSIPPTIDVAALAVKRAAAAGQLAVDVAFWGGAVPSNTTDLQPLHQAGVVGFKCFLLPSGVEEFPQLSPDRLTEAMTTIAGFGGLLIAHAEDEGIIAAAPRPGGRRYADFLASRPPDAETAAIEMLLSAARRTGARVHIVHLSSAQSLPIVAAAKADGLPLTVETCPHYLTLAAERIPDGATQFKCCPPIRDQAHRDALWESLRTGIIDCVVSDHSPCTPAAKRHDSGDFGSAWGGIASLQLGLPVVWTEARQRGFSLVDLAGWMAEAPARLTGLVDRGRIATGARADFCVLAPDETFAVDPARLRHRHPENPYIGASLHGVVRETWLGGAPIRDGERRGRLVARAAG
jgi:allantoinase